MTMTEDLLGTWYSCRLGIFVMGNSLWALRTKMRFTDTLCSW